MKDILFKKFKINDEEVFIPDNKKEKLTRRKKKKDVVLDGQLSKEQSKSLKKYRQGGEGFILWVMLFHLL